MALDTGYAFHNYAGYDIIIDTHSKYVNGTNLVSRYTDRNGDPRQIRDWINTATFDNITAHLGSRFSIRERDLIFFKRSGSELVRGVYIHPGLVSHALYWASFTFAEECLPKYLPWIENTCSAGISTDSHHMTADAIISNALGLDNNNKPCANIDSLFSFHTAKVSQEANHHTVGGAHVNDLLGPIIPLNNTTQTTQVSNTDLIAKLNNIRNRLNKEKKRRAMLNAENNVAKKQKVA